MKNKVEKSDAFRIVLDSKASNSANVLPAGSGDLSPSKVTVVGLSQQIRFLCFGRLQGRQISILFSPQVSLTTSFEIFIILMVTCAASIFSV